MAVEIATMLVAVVVVVVVTVVGGVRVIGKGNSNCSNVSSDM